MSAPKVFGRELVRQSTPGELYVLRLGAYDDCVTLYKRGPYRWFAEAPGHIIVRGTDGEDALRKLEAQIRELVQSLGPLVGWAPLEKP